MTTLTWDQTGQRVYETGVDRGVLYLPDNTGDYTSGFAWNGLTTVTEKPSGAESSPQYADNIKYLNLVSAEEFGATLEAFTYPDEFAECDGTITPTAGVAVGQQTRKTFGLGYRSQVGNDLVGTAAGYKLHLIYGCLAAPSEKAYATVNDSPEALAFSWEVTTTPVDIGTVGGQVFKPTSSIIVDSTKVDAGALSDLEDQLYGTDGVDPVLPAPADVLAMFSGTVVEAVPVAPSYTSGTHTIAIPTVVGVVYKINGEIVTGSVVITEDTVVTAAPLAGYKFPAVTDNDWLVTYSA